MGVESSSSATSNMIKPIKNPIPNPRSNVAKYAADATNLADFEQSNVFGEPFDYSKSIISPLHSVPEEQMTAYLSGIQRGGLVQPFGCLLAVEESGFRIIACSENCLELLGLSSGSSSPSPTSEFVFKDVKGLIGIDASTLFTPSSGASLAKSASLADISLMNPILVYSRTTQKPFHAILHRIDVGIVIDLEPAKSIDHALSLAGAIQSQKLAVRAISRLQSLPEGDIGALCDTVVEDVQRLTGYDRVMVYKFHEDDHGEVVSEIRRSDLEPYLGLHYPATDIPQAARFLFKQNRVRLIHDCNAMPVRVVQSEELKQPLCLVNSTLRAPHGCHMQYMANMGSISSLVMAVVINSKDSSKLWGLVVCHHTFPRYVPFPLRYACEFLMQAFGLQLHMELQLASQLAEKKVLRMQTLLCDMLLRDAPPGIVTQSPSIMDLVKCDGAALYHDGKCWLVGVTPTESQVKDIADWLLKNHSDSTGLSTDSLVDAGYPGAMLLGDEVCGMATAQISSKDFLFWFRSKTAKEVKWGGAKHHPADKDEGERMHPRSSFKAFLEVVKSRSLPWEISEINAIHSLQLIMRESFPDVQGSSSRLGPDQVGAKDVNELTSVAYEMARLIETATVPIFGVDSCGCINGWNKKIAELTGLQASEAVGKSLPNHIVQSESRAAAVDLLCRALQGDEDKNIVLKLKKFGHNQPDSDVHVLVNACTSRDYTNKIIGVCFVGQDITDEKDMTDKFIRMQGDYKTIVQSLNPLIPPIFASDENACCSEWNAAMEKLTGWAQHEVIRKMLPGEVFGDLCRVKSQDALTKFMILLYRGMGINGQDSEKSPFGFFNKEGKYVEAILTANKRTNSEGKVVGCFCFLQIVNPDPDRETGASWQQHKESNSRLDELAYIRQEIKNPLNGIRITHKLLEATEISESQKQFLETSDACERQIMMIIEGLDLRSIEEGTLQLNTEEFLLGSLLDAIVSQVMILLRERNLQLRLEVPEGIKTLHLYGDKVRLQLVLADFLQHVVHHTPFPDSWVEFEILKGARLVRDGDDYIHLQLRMIHPGEGLPSEKVREMFDTRNQWTTPDGLGLNLCRKLLEQMNGKVNYVREDNRCYFHIDLELRTKREIERGIEASSSKVT